MKAYYCVGGPLDGEYATSKDFHGNWETNEDGMYSHLRKEYAAYNSSGWSYVPQGDKCSRLWIHKDYLKPGISPRGR